jgi:hypothetical protein
MKLHEIKRAVLNGYPVHWANSLYDVVHVNGLFSILCNDNGKSCTGLTWTDGKTMNGKEYQFYIGLNHRGVGFRFRDEVRPMLKSLCEQLAAANLNEDEAWSRQSSDPARDGVYGMLHKAMMRIVELETSADVVRDLNIEWSVHCHSIDDIEVAVEAELVELAEIAGGDEEPPERVDPRKIPDWDWMNGQPIYVDDTMKPTTIFIPIPRRLAKPCGGPRCSCPYCVAHPGEEPMWDTLAMPYDHTGNQHTWTVHHPDLGKVRPLREFIGRKKVN